MRTRTVTLNSKQFLHVMKAVNAFSRAGNCKWDKSVNWLFNTDKNLLKEILNMKEIKR